MKKFKRGDVREDGMVFFRMSRGKEYWLTPTTFDERVEKLRAKQDKYYKDNRHRLLDQKKEYHQQNKEEILAKKKEYHQEHRDEILAYNHDYYTKNHQRLLKQKRDYHRSRDKNVLRAQQKDYYEANKERISEKKKEWAYNNRDAMNAHRRNRWASDPLFRLASLLSSRIWEVRRKNGYTKKSKIAKILGCSFENLMQHLEAQFTNGMSWDNMGNGGWHADHRLPVAAATTEEELIALNHYTNLQPMWSTENIAKQDKHCPKELAEYLAIRLQQQPLTSES